MKGGWLKIWRQLEEWEYFYDPIRLRSWLKILFKAETSDVVKRGIVVKRGQWLTSYREMAREFSCSLPTAEKVISDFIKCNQVRTLSERKFTIVTVCNYDNWQGEESNKCTQTYTLNDTQIDTQIDTPTYTHTLYKKKENKKKENNITTTRVREKNFGEGSKDTIGDSENGLAARAKNFQLPKMINADEIGAWLVNETSTEWKEHVCCEFRCNMTDLPFLFGSYVDELKLQGVDMKSETDIKSHFVNMMRVKTRLSKTDKSGEVSPQVDALLNHLFN